MRDRPLAILATIVLAMTGQAAVAQTNVLDPAGVQRFVDVHMAALLKQSWTPGAVVAVVQGGQVVTLAGVGVADVNTRHPVDPTRTLFRVGSITKVMTAIAALRLADRGVLDLDKDLNSYLSAVHIPDTFAQPVTARVILSHHGGFETVLHHLQVQNEAAAVMSIQQMERALIRVRPVGAPRIYDDLSFGLLGYTLANIAGKPYATVLEEEVFHPLGMDHAGVGLPAARQADAASCHELGPDGKARVCKQAILVDLAQPAGDATVTGADMAAFMVGLLQPGLVLSRESLAQMRDGDARRLHPLVPGLGVPLWESSAAGRVLYGHTGGIDGFLSVFALFPGSDVGVFVSVNMGFGSAPDMSITGLIASQPPKSPPGLLGPKELVLKFLDDFATQFVAPNAPPEAPRIAAANSMSGVEPLATELVGAYFRSDQSRSLVVNLLATLTGERINANADGSLTVNGRGPFVHYAKSYYRYTAADGKRTGYAFKRDAAGRQLTQSDEPWSAPFGIHQLQPWYATAGWALLPIPLLILFQSSAFVRLRWERDKYRRRMLKIAGVGATAFFAALLLELQFGELVDHSVRLHAVGLAWRLLFPIVSVAFLYNLYLMIRGLITVADEPIRRPMAQAYASLAAFSGLGLAWLAFFWGLNTLFLRK